MMSSESVWDYTPLTGILSESSVSVYGNWKGDLKQIWKAFVTFGLVRKIKAFV